MQTIVRRLLSAMIATFPVRGNISMSPETAFGQILKKHRTNMELSQIRLGLLCNLDRTYISLLERGKRQPTLGTILSLSAHLNISASDMVRETCDLMIEE